MSSFMNYLHCLVLAFLCYLQSVSLWYNVEFFFYHPSMYIPLGREEEDCENIYTDDFFFWIHKRGVDLLVIFIFLHLLENFI